MANDDLIRRLTRLSPHTATPAPPEPARIHERYQILANSLNATLIENGHGTCCLIQKLSDIAHLTDEFTCLQAYDFPSLPVAAFTANEAEGMVSLRNMLFLDTETTGLGGAGAVAFLIGVGRLVDCGLEVKQYLLPDYADEAAMLELLMNDFGDDLHLVTYNGAAFDLPVLRDRLVINRVGTDFPVAGHLDLLHPTRRLFKRRLRDCQLTNIERMVFGYERVDDIPGYLCPSVYFDWLTYQQTERLSAVVEHNRLDIVSLLALAIKIASVFQTRGEILYEHDDIHSLSRVYRRRKRHEDVIVLVNRLEDRNPDQPELAKDILLFNAYACKRLGQWDRAVTIWRRLTEFADSKEAFLAHLELAKYYERQGEDLQEAWRHATTARKLCSASKSRQAELDRRLARLSIKLGR